MAHYKSGDIIRMTRQALELTQEELCENICSVETLSRIENGKNRVKRGTYRRLMEKMERVPEKSYAICTGKNMELLEERKSLEDMVSRFDYGKASKYFQVLEQKIGNGILNKQYLKTVKSIVEYGNKYIDIKRYTIQLEDALRITLPDFEQYMDKKYPYTELEMLILIKLVETKRREKKYEEGIRIYQSLLSSLQLGYMLERDSIILEIIIMRNMALIFEEMEKYEKSNKLLEQVIQRLKETDYGNMYPSVFWQMARNMMNQIENGERSKEEIVRVKAYIRQAYYIASARNESMYLETIRNYFERKFGENIEIN